MEFLRAKKKRAKRDSKVFERQIKSVQRETPKDYLQR